MIVEDDPFIAIDVEDALREEGCDVCAVASSEVLALSLAEDTRPEYAVVDVELSPGDGRVVATELHGRYGTAVLMATGHCDDLSGLADCGATGCLPKPYRSGDVMPALAVIREIIAGRPPGVLPGHMIAL